MTIPPEQPTLEYATTGGFGSAPTLVMLHGIFMAVIAGLGLLWTALMVFYAFFMPIMMHRVGAAASGPAPGFEIVMIALVFGLMALVSIGAAAVQGIAAWKLLRKSPRHAWGWGLAAAIVSCGSVWCAYGCVLPVGAGIFGIIALAQEPTRRYIASWKAAAPGPSEAL